MLSQTTKQNTEIKKQTDYKKLEKKGWKNENILHNLCEERTIKSQTKMKLFFWVDLKKYEKYPAQKPLDINTFEIFLCPCANLSHSLSQSTSCTKCLEIRLFAATRRYTKSINVNDQQSTKKAFYAFEIFLWHFSMLLLVFKICNLRETQKTAVKRESRVLSFHQYQHNNAQKNKNIVGFFLFFFFSFIQTYNQQISDRIPPKLCSMDERFLEQHRLAVEIGFNLSL